MLHKGKLELRNFTPILLLTTLGKVFSAELNERLCKWSDRGRMLSEKYNGVRVNWKAEGNIFCHK